MKTHGRVAQRVGALRYWRDWRGRAEDIGMHRLQGPAVEHDDGSKEWYQKGLLHRLDGPAKEMTEELAEDENRCEYYYADAIVVPKKEAYVKMAAIAEEMVSHPGFDPTRFNIIEI